MSSLQRFSQLVEHPLEVCRGQTSPPFYRKETYATEGLYDLLSVKHLKPTGFFFAWGMRRNESVTTFMMWLQHNHLLSSNK